MMQLTHPSGQQILVLIQKKYEICTLSEMNNRANTDHFYNICTTSAQRLRRWFNLVQMLYKMFCVCWEYNILFISEILHVS